MKRLISRIISVFMLFYCLLGNTVIPHTAVRAAELQPEIKIILPDNMYVGKSSSIQILVENVTDLYGYSVNYIYDPKIVSVGEVKAGDIYNSQATLAKELSNEVNNDTGSVAYNRVLTTKVAGANGNGSLITLQVKPQSLGNIPFNITRSAAEKLSLSADTLKIMLTDSKGQPINYVSTSIVKSTEFDTKPASVVSINPSDNAAEVSIKPEISVTYDETIVPGSKFNDITLLDINNKPVAVNASIDNNVLKITPRGELENYLVYRLLIPAEAIQDEVANVTTTEYKATFTTEKAKEDINKDGYINIFDIAPVAWNYDVQETDTGWAANYDVHVDGVINMLDLIAIAKKFVVHQAVKINDIKDTTATIFQGSTYKLPTEVQAVMSDGTVRNVAVTWNPGTIDTTKLGTYLFEGTVKQYISKARLFVNIVKPTNGNTNGNLVNGGYYQKQLDWVYYVDNTDDRMLYKKNIDGSGIQKLSDVDYNVHHINVVGDWIYYASDLGLNKVKLDGSERTNLDSNWGIGEVSVVNNWIYYIANYGNLYRRSAAGGDSQFLSIWNVSEFNVAGDNVYYIQNGSLCKSTLDGSSQSILQYGNLGSINVVNDFIYFINRVYNNMIYKMKIDGTETQVVSSDMAYYLNIAGDTIYYANGYDNGSIYSMKLDGSNKAKAANTALVNDFINITGDWIYYINYDGNSGIGNCYKVKLDGSSRQRAISITNIKSMTKSINQGDYFYLPYTVTALLENGRTQDLSVTWSNYSIDTNTPGDYTVEGTVDGYSGKVVLTVTVKAVDQSEIVTFADPNLESAVRAQINKPYGNIYKADVANITYLYRASSSITNLSGIENLINLQDLELWGNQISDVSPLSNLKNLYYLDLQNNKLSDISALGNLTNLQTLLLDGNSLTDISALVNLSKLSCLYLQNNQISTVDALSGLQNLYALYLSGNPITDYTPLAGIYNNLMYKDFTIDNNTSQIESIENIKVSITQGTYYEFPASINATFTDGSTGYVAVTWNSYDIDTNTPGIYTFEGTVEGYSNKVMLQVTVEADEILTFPDSGLESAIRDQIGNRDKPILKSQVERITEMWVYDTPISNLSGIENLVNLERLGLIDTGTKDANPLLNLPKLHELHYVNNGIVDVSQFASFYKLDRLNLSDNNITDISPLKGLANLKYLYLAFNKISDISTIKGLTNLEELSLYQNQVNDINPLSGLTKLRLAELGANEISDLTPLRETYNLHQLYIGSNPISDISPLSGLTNLENLDLLNTSVSDIKVLENMPNLVTVDLQNTQISDITPLRFLNNLYLLNINGTSVSDITPISGLTNLRQLYLAYTRVDNIDSLSGLTDLEGLSIADLNISDFSVIKSLTKLTYLDLSYTHINDISVIQNLSGLYTLSLSGNQITDISPVAGLTNLAYLYLSNNQISDISSLRNLTNLYGLYLSDNNITDVAPLSNLSSLRYLYLANNQITDYSPLATIYPQLWGYDFNLD